MKIQKLLILVLITFFSVILFLACHKFQQDDAYIFYTYARNIAEGNGYVFNIGEKINATTSPLYTLLLASLYYILQFVIKGVQMPVIGELIGAVSIWISAYLLYKIFLLFKKERLAILAPIFFFVNPLFRNGAGMESFLVIALVLSTLYFLFDGKEKPASFFASLAVLARFDAILFVILLLGWYIFKNKKLPSINNAIIFLLPLFVWFFFSYLYFGSFLPTTVNIKLQQEKLNFYGSGLIFLKGFLRVFPGGALTLVLFLAAALVSKLFVFSRNKSMLFIPPVFILLIWTGLYFVVYSFLLNPPPYPWYYTPFILTFAMLFTLAAEQLYLLIKSRYIFIGFLLIVIITGMVVPIKQMRAPQSPKYQIYTKASEFLNFNAPEGSSVMIDEIGIVRYFYEKGKIIDAFGLVNPESADKLLQKDYSWTILHYKPDYIVTDYPNTPEYINIKNMAPVKDFYKSEIILSRGNQVIIYKKEKSF